MFHHGLPPKHLPPSKCIKSILFICSCVYMLRLSSLPADRHFVSTHASLTVVLKPLNRGVRQKSSSFCLLLAALSKKEGRESLTPPLPALHCMWHHALQISSAGTWREANVNETSDLFIQRVFIYSVPNICQTLYSAQRPQC